ncbi:MAG: class I SAM-dependent methyltransferase [Clostridia bacterium]|nr:class I SAM-dependent methyltransferase [Clostridia bacterium]
MTVQKPLAEETNFDTNPPIELSKYDEAIRQFCAAYDPLFDMTYSFLKSMTKENSELLIVGSGTGMEIVTFGLKNPKWKFTGVDPSAEMLSIAEKKIRDSKLENSVDLFNGYTHELAEGAKYDAATCILVMHFLNDDGAKLELLESIGSRLKSGAPFILVDGFGVKGSEEFNRTIAAWKMFAISVGVDSEAVEDGFKNQILKRIQFVSEDRIKELLREAGFHSISRYYTSFLYGGWVAEKI